MRKLILAVLLFSPLFVKAQGQPPKIYKDRASIPKPNVQGDTIVAYVQGQGTIWKTKDGSTGVYAYAMGERIVAKPQPAQPGRIGQYYEERYSTTTGQTGVYRLDWNNFYRVWSQTYKPDF